MKKIIICMLFTLLLISLLTGCGAKTVAALPQKATDVPAATQAPTPEPTATPEPTPEPTPYGQFLWREAAFALTGYTDDNTPLQSASEQWGMVTEGKIVFVILENSVNSSASATHELLEAMRLIGPDGAAYSTGVSANDGRHTFLEYDIPSDANLADYTARIAMDDGSELLIALSELPVWTGNPA